MSEHILGILGGLGPMSSVYFYELLTQHTRAERDQDHLNLLLSSRADTPDRTDFLLGRSQSSPLPSMIREAQRLEKAGASLLTLPCNTAHVFYEGICDSISIPLLNIIQETSSFCHALGLQKVGLLATEGTISSGSYRNTLQALNISYETCSDEEQAVISRIIYGQIKQGFPPDSDAFFSVVDRLMSRGCQRIILGCTELSLLKRAFRNDLRLIDSMEVLAAVAIHRCGKSACGFDDELSAFAANIPQLERNERNSPCCFAN